MGRTRNPDYFKVGGGTAGSGSSPDGRFGEERARMTAERASLKRRGGKAASATKGRAAAAKTAAPGPGPADAPRVAERPGETEVAPTVVRDVRETHPTHGKKRRSAKKRHDVAVERALSEEHESATGGQMEQAPASVTDLHHARIARERAAEVGPATLPPTVQTLIRRALTVAKDAVELVWEIVTAPITVARLLARMRERES